MPITTIQIKTLITAPILGLNDANKIIDTIEAQIKAPASVTLDFTGRRWTKRFYPRLQKLMAQSDLNYALTNYQTNF